MRAHLLAVAVLLTTISSASADAPYSGYKDEAAVTQYRSEPTSYRRASDDSIRNYLTKDELRQLKRIKRNAESRRKGRKVSAAAYAVQPVRYEREPRTVYIERREDDRRSLYVKGDRRECKPTVEASGRERGTRARALENAYLTWGEEVNARWNWKYNNVDRARGLNEECGVLRTNKFGIKIWKCSITAQPCRNL